MDNKEKELFQYSVMSMVNILDIVKKTNDYVVEKEMAIMSNEQSNDSKVLTITTLHLMFSTLLNTLINVKLNQDENTIEKPMAYKKIRQIAELSKMPLMFEEGFGIGKKILEKAIDDWMELFLSNFPEEREALN